MRAPLPLLLVLQRYIGLESAGCEAAQLRRAASQGLAGDPGRRRASPAPPCGRAAAACSGVPKGIGLSHGLGPYVRCSAVVLALLAAGCAQTFVTVDRQPGFNGSWSLESTSLDVQGSTATISCGGRLFVFEGVDWLRGRIDKEGISLHGADGFRVHVDKDRIVIRDGKLAADQAVASLLAGGRFVWQDGTLKPR